MSPPQSLRRLWPWPLALLVVSPGCFLDRAALGGGADASPQVGDAGSHDAARRDAGRLDAGHRDAALPDAAPDAHILVDTGPYGGDACRPQTEICNGVDDDCDPETSDGDGDPARGAPCDALDDLDLCLDGVIECIGGSLVCTGDDGDEADEVELCDGLDNDCDPETLDGAADPGVGLPCDGVDTDVCMGGISVCLLGSIACDDATEGSIETCNGADDDCDGAIDDGADCPCASRTRDGRPYLFCGASDERKEWAPARDFCRTLGYELVTIGDEAEQRWVREQADDVAAGDWWIGATDRDEHAREGTWVWVGDSSALGYTNWSGGEPNNWFGEDCGELRTGSNGRSGVPGGWNDDECSNSSAFVCEAVP